MQWNSPQINSPVNYQTQGLLSPGYGGTTYSFTADFRTPQEPQILTTNYKTSVPVSVTPPRKKHSLILDDDCQKPNVCRICGK